MATLLDPRRLTVVLDTGLQSGETRPGAWVPRRRGDISDQTVGRASRTRRLRQSREAVSLRSFLWSSLLLRRPSAWLREGGLCLNPSPPLPSSCTWPCPKLCQPKVRPPVLGTASQAGLGQPVRRPGLGCGSARPPPLLVTSPAQAIFRGDGHVASSPHSGGFSPHLWI